MVNRKTKLNIAQALLMVCMVVFIIIMISSNSAGTVPVSEMDETIKTMEGINELLKKDDMAVSRAFGYIPSEYLYYKSNDIMDVRELFIAKAADDDEMEQIESAVRSRLDTQIENFTGYGTDQLEKLENAILMKKGSYYFYAVGDEALLWQSAFLKLVG